MTERNIFFYGNDKVLKLKQNPSLTTVFDIFPATKVCLRKILNHKHQWVTNSGYYIPSEVKGEWVKTVSLCMLTLGILSEYRNGVATRKNLSINDKMLNQEIESLLPDQLFNHTVDLIELKKSLLTLLPKLMDEYLAKNFGQHESLITNGVAKLLIDNAEELDLQLLNENGSENISILKFTKNSEELKNTKNYLLVKVIDAELKLKINFTNSAEHAAHLGRILHTLTNDQEFKISKETLNLGDGDDHKQDIYVFQSTAIFLDFYNSLLLETYFYMDHGTVLEHINEYKGVNASLNIVDINLEKNLGFVIDQYSTSGDMKTYLEGRSKLLNIVHTAAKSAEIKLDVFDPVVSLDQLLMNAKAVTLTGNDVFKQIVFIK